MAKRVIKLKSKVHEADPGDMYKGWIRVSEDLREDIPNRVYVRVIANNRKVYCQIRGTPGKAGLVEINEWYRNALGWTDPPNEAELTIEEVGLLGRISAWSSHPDDIVRVAIGLGMISVGLGLLSTLRAYFPPIIRLMTSNSLFEFIGGIVLFVVGLFLILVTMFLLGRGFWTFFRKFPKPIEN